MGDQLYRSPTDRVIAGVAGGIAAWIRVDSSIVRVAWVLGAIFSFGLFVLVYIVMMIVVPLAPEGWAPPAQTRATPGGNAVPGWGQPTGTGQAAAGSQATPGAAPAWQGQAAGPAPGSAPAWQSPAPAAWDGSAAARGGRLVAGTVLVVLGLWLLVGEYVNIDWNLVWPLVVMGAGVLLIAAALRRRDR